MGNYRYERNTTIKLRQNVPLIVMQCMSFCGVAIVMITGITHCQHCDGDRVVRRRPQFHESVCVCVLPYLLDY